MSEPQFEATSIFKGALDNLLKGSVDIKNMLRCCAHACQILNWSEQLGWLNSELYGYTSDVELPSYRRNIKGHITWRVCGGIRIAIASAVEDQFRTESEPITDTYMDVYAGIDWILSAGEWGYTESTGQKSEKYMRTERKNVETEQVRVFDKTAFQAILTAIENSVFHFVSQSYSILCYGDALQDVWQAYRTKVDEQLASIGFSGHLDTIRTGLNSNNPQDWRAAMWSCRDILRDIAAYLWQDPRNTYEYLPGQGKDGKLPVTQSHYVNRLGAYLHQKGITGKTREYIGAEMERIYHSIETLNELDSEAHDVVTLSDARTAAIGTYTILGELVTRTDMKPVTKYDAYNW